MQINGFCQIEELETTPQTGDTIESLLLEGEWKLLKGQKQVALTLFEQAQELDASHPRLYTRQALVLLEYGCQYEDEKAIAYACKCFKKASLLEPHEIEIWHNWGVALALLGNRRGGQHYFDQAIAKYEKAIALCEKQPDAFTADLYWDYGCSWLKLGDYSEEAVDWQCALRAFEKTSQLVHPLPSEFWCDFGQAALNLADKLGDIRLLMKAIHGFKNATLEEPASFKSWAFLADGVKELYFISHDEDHFIQANECYAAASKLSPQDPNLWLDWAKLLCLAGRRTKEVKKLRASLEKCYQAYARDGDNPHVLATWAEALSLLGQLTERLDLLHEAQNKMAEALQITEDDDEVWHAYGLCLNSFAVYYNDSEYHYEAIEKFQNGLSLNRALPHLWHGLANCYNAIGHMDNDTSSLEKSLKFYGQAMDLAPNHTTILFDYATNLAKLGEITHNEHWLELAILQFEFTLNLQKNAVYVHPDWLFHYASTLDILGDFHDDESYYTRAIEIFSHVLMIDPDFPRLQHRLAQAYCHLGELLGEVDHFYRAIHHLRLALKQEDEDDQMILDWGIVLINIAEHIPVLVDAEQVFGEAEQKLTLAARLGNAQAYYHLSCLYSLTKQYEKSFYHLLKADSFKALPPIEEILSDEWLEDLRGTSDFRSFLSNLERRPNYHEER